MELESTRIPFYLVLKRLFFTLWVFARYASVYLAGGISGSSGTRRRQYLALRQAMEKLGMTYMKFGQFLAMRQDIITPDLAKELNVLLEHAIPIPIETIREIIVSEFNHSLEDVFIRFEPVPVATASVAQVHAAVLKNGDQVAVKVRRPDVVTLFSIDIHLLTLLGRLVDFLHLFGTLSALEAIEQFAVFTKRELDFRIEAQTARRLREESLPQAAAPKIYDSLSSERLLVMEFMHGVSIANLCELIETGQEEAIEARLPNFDRNQVLQNLTHASLHQLFVKGFFHGDPHPGNIIVRADNSVAFIDFGIFGELSQHDKEMFSAYIEFLALGNIHKCYQYISRIYVPTRKSDRLAFKADTIATLNAWYRASKNAGSALAHRHIGKSFDVMVKVVQRHHYRTTLSYLIFWRALIVLDSIALRLSPEFDLTDVTSKFFMSIRESPSKRYWDCFWDPAYRLNSSFVVHDLPIQINRMRDAAHPPRASAQASNAESAGLSARRAGFTRIVSAALLITSISFLLHWRILF